MGSRSDDKTCNSQGSASCDEREDDPQPTAGARPAVSVTSISARSRALALQLTIMHALAVGQAGRIRS